MALSSFPNEVCMMMASNLQLRDLLQLGASSSPIRAISMKTADTSATAELDGLEGGCFPRMPCCTDDNHRICLCAALQPYCVVSGRRQFWPQQWPDMTIPFRFSLETRGPLFCEFLCTVSKTINGTPMIGLIDAESASIKPQDFSDWWPGDYFRGEGGKDLFATGFSPACSTVIATTKALQGQTTSTRRGREYYAAPLNWDELGDCTRRWNTPIHAALFLENGNLTFYRKRNDQWQSSGIIITDLPRKVLPCIFLSSFIGFVDINFIHLKKSAPVVCPDCDRLGHGLVDGWRRIVRQASLGFRRQRLADKGWFSLLDA